MIVSVLYLVHLIVFASPRNFLHVSNLVTFMKIPVVLVPVLGSIFRVWRQEHAYIEKASSLCTWN